MREIRVIGPYTAGEKPKIDVHFYATPQNLSGFDVDMKVERDGTEINWAGSIDWVEDSEAHARITAGEGDIDVADGAKWSRYKLEAWSGDGTSRIATLLVVFDVFQHVGADHPNI